eukprot:TRINITY_DN4238_c0_g1_i1.p1 TRINITY_DN4238_c0_g1~~TRINITY_DN4238_c0_g1_i1.p1  ORF type:complete len:176 (+),score=26.30 TRINITY_DN4238_c0_g1_i1:3-530(+)
MMDWEVVLRVWLLVVVVYNAAGALLLQFRPEALAHLFPGALSSVSHSDHLPVDGGDEDAAGKNKDKKKRQRREPMAVGVMRRVLISWIWTFAAVRLLLAYDPYNPPLLLATAVTFVIWLAWNYSEICVARTVPFRALAFGVAMGTISLVLLAVFACLSHCGTQPISVPNHHHTII